MATRVNPAIHAMGPPNESSPNTNALPTVSMMLLVDKFVKMAPPMPETSEKKKVKLSPVALASWKTPQMQVNVTKSQYIPTVKVDTPINATTILQSIKKRRESEKERIF